MRAVRTAARAVILREGKLLAIRMRDDRGFFYILPGGGQRHGEQLEETVKRECREELGTDVRVTGFAYLREYIGKNHGFRSIHGRFHQVEVVFYCELVDENALGNGSEPDRKQVGWAWLSVDALSETPFYPKGILGFFREGKLEADRPYLGDMN